MPSSLFITNTSVPERAVVLIPQSQNDSVVATGGMIALLFFNDKGDQEDLARIHTISVTASAVYGKSILAVVSIDKNTRISFTINPEDPGGASVAIGQRTLLFTCK